MMCSPCESCISLMTITPCKLVNSPTDNFIHDMTSRVSMRQLHFNHNKQHAGKMNTRINKGKRVCIHRSLIVSREVKVPCQYIRETYSVGRELTIVFQHTEFQKPSNWNVEEKQRETCMFTSFFKRELRTNSTLPIHRILKVINENKQRG